MEWLTIILLILLGIGLIIAEVIFIPGATFVGLLGVLLNILGIYFGYEFFGDVVGHLCLSLSVLINIVTLYYGFTAKTWDKFAIKNRIDAKINEDKLSLLGIGDLGTTVSVLKPVGNAEFKNQTYEVSSTTGTFIEAGELIAIVKIEGKKIFVQKLHHS